MLCEECRAICNRYEQRLIETAKALLEETMRQTKKGA